MQLIPTAAAAAAAAHNMVVACVGAVLQRLEPACIAVHRKRHAWAQGSLTACTALVQTTATIILLLLLLIQLIQICQCWAA